MAGRDSIHRRLSFLLPRALWKPFCKLYVFNHAAVFNFTVGVSLMIRNGLSSAARFFLRYFKMRVWVRLSCAVGNVFNDFYRQLLQSFELLFFMKVVELSASEAGLIILIGEIADALFSPITGYLGDLVNLPFLSKRIGRRKSWHLLATVVMAVALPLLFNRCFLCADNHQSWLPLFYFGFFSALVNICFNMVEINHMAFITAVVESVEEFTILGALRSVLNNLFEFV